MHDNDHVPTPPPLYGHELNLLVIGDTMAWIPAFVVPALLNLRAEEEDRENDNQLQRKAQPTAGEKTTRCRSCHMWPELLCDRPDCRHAPRDGNRRE